MLERIAIIGPGAMGSLFAYLLTKAGKDVWLLDIHPRRVDKIRKEGLRIEGISGEDLVKVKITSRSLEVGEVDLLIIFVKSYDTERAIKDSLPLITPETSILTLQNGLGNLERIEEVVGPNKVIGGITSHGATLLGWGHIRHAGRGETVIGEGDGRITQRLKDIASLFNSLGIETVISDNVEGVVWGKLLVNIGINPLTAILGVRNGELVNYSETKAILREAVAEAFGVSKAKGIRLPFEDPFQKVESVLKATAINISSMLQDILNQKRTEIDYINGAVVEEGKRLGIKTPVNHLLTSLVKGLEKTHHIRIER